MPFRPASAPTGHNGVLAQRRKAPERTGHRVQFAGPEIVGSQCERRLPKDPLPDSDEERDVPGWSVTPSPPSKNAEVKWWHVPDTQIEELVQHIEEQAGSPCEVGHSTTLNQTGHSALSSSSTLCSSKFASSSSCRALAVSGRPKLRSLPNKIGLLETRQTDFSATSCSSEIERLEMSGTSASSSASPQKKKFSSVASAKTMLLESRPLPFNAHPKRPFTAPELSTRKRDGSASAASLEQQQRPWSSSSTTRPKTSGSSKEISASEKDLIQVELRFYSGNDRIKILIHPDAPMGPSPGSKALFDKASLKGMIAKLTGIANSDQRLLCRGFDVGHDHKSLRQLGISQSSVVMVYDKKDWQKNQTDVVLACTAKLLQKQEAAQQQAKRHAAFLKGRKGTSQKIMPKWGWGAPPNTFIATKKGWHATGQDMSSRFEDHFSWRDNEETPSLSGIRAGLTFTQPIELVS